MLMVKPTSYRDYRTVLLMELQARKSLRHTYSLRSFARDLKLAPSRLCEILNGKQGLSPDYAKIVSSNCELNPIDSKYFIDLVASECARSRIRKIEARKCVEDQYYRTTLVTFQHDALSLVTSGMYIDIFNAVDRKLGPVTLMELVEGNRVTATEIVEVVFALERLGIVEWKHGAVVRSTIFTPVSDIIPMSLILQTVSKICSIGRSQLAMEVTRNNFPEWLVQLARTQCKKAMHSLQVNYYVSLGSC